MKPCVWSSSCRSHRFEHRNERRRQHEIGEPQRRKYRVRERAEIKRPAAAIECRQRGNGSAGVGEFALVVVLDDPSAVRLDVADEREPALQRKRDPGRILG